MKRTSVFFDVCSVEEFKEISTLLDVCEYQLSPGKLIDQCFLAVFPHLTLGYRFSSAARHIMGVSTDRAVGLVFPVGTEPVLYNGRCFPQNRQISIIRNQDISSFFPKKYGHYFISFDIDALTQIMGSSDAEHFINSVQNISKIEVSKKEKRKITAFVKSYFWLLFKNEDSLSSDLAIKDATNSILHQLSCYLNFHGLYKTSSKKHSTTFAVKPLNRQQQLLSQSIELLHNIDISNLTISKLASECHVSVRTLEYAFKDLLGLTPKHYLTGIRFTKIHNELKNPNNRDKLIRDIIQQYGVTNTGRFAKDYKLFFGETPRETRKRYSPASKR